MTLGVVEALEENMEKATAMTRKLKIKTESLEPAIVMLSQNNQSKEPLIGSRLCLVCS